MVQTITSFDFHKAFEDYDRQNNFSYEALDLLFDYFERLEEDTGEPYELDVIGICCDYTEATLDEVNSNLGTDFEDLDEAQRYLEQHTSVVGLTQNTIVYQDY